MSIKIGANLAYNGKLPNFERDSFKTKAAMKAFDENSIDEGHLSYCEEDGNIYEYKSANAVDATTGRWRLFKTEADATLNGTSTNAIQNKAVFDALKLKADAVALDKYQYKYNASFVAQSDILVEALPKDTKGVDLNGFTLNITKDTTLTRSFIINGTIAVADTCTLTFAVDNCSNVIIKKAGTKDIYIAIEKGNFDTCNFGGLTKITSTSDYEIKNSIFQNDLSIIGSGGTDMYCSIIYGDILFNNINSYIVAKWCDIYGDINVSHTGLNFSTFIQCIIAGESYLCATMTESGDYVESGTIDIRQDNTSSVSSKAVYDALQLKADKTQLDDLATKTELNDKADKTQLNNYVTTATANTTYAKKSDISNIYKFKGTKTNYADLPTTDRVIGDVWNITNADAEHGIKAGDNVAWNGTVWDNLSGTVDLSAYATKDKAFTKDTVSTGPNQFLAGPINTRGNIGLRKIDISDIPNLASKYQKVDTNGFQQFPKIICASIGASPEQLYLVARTNTTNNYKASPDWYFATDGTLQDIKTKIPKVTLDDAVSTTSTNGVENQAITQYVDSKVTTINSSIADIRTSLESTQTDFVDLRNKVNAMPKTVFITQAAYNALTTKDPNTIYYING